MVQYTTINGTPVLAFQHDRNGQPSMWLFTTPPSPHVDKDVLVLDKDVLVLTIRHHWRIARTYSKEDGTIAWYEVTTAQPIEVLGWTPLPETK